MPEVNAAGQPVRRHSTQPELFLVFLLVLALLPSVISAWVFWHRYPDELFGPNHQLVVRDYLNLWAGGRLAAAGRTDIIFDPYAYPAWLWSIFGPHLDLHSWGYPPHLLLLAVPLSWLPLVPGFIVWIAATSMFLYAVLRAGGMPRPYVLAVVLSPAALESALVGQTGTLISAALAGGLLLARTRPLAAGALLGLLTIKPQLGLLVPFCLLAQRDWRTIAFAAMFGVGYCAAGLAAFGWDAWNSYLTVMAPFMRSYIEAPFGLAAHFMMVPPFITMRAAGAGLGWAYGMQAVVSMACIVLAWLAWSSRQVDRCAAIALTLCLAPLRGTERIMLAPAWIWPGSAFAIGTQFLPGLGAFCVALAAVVAARQIWSRASVTGDPRR
jgi:hypothetical protein